MGKYLSLRYNPNWKNTKEAVEFSEAEKSHQVAGGSSVDFSQGSFYLHSNSSPTEMYQQEATSQGSCSDFGAGTELQSFHGPDAVISSEPLRLHTKGKESAAGRHFRHSPSTYGSAFSLQIREDPPRRQKKDFVERNKQTLGLRSGKTNSYLQLHAKKQEVVLQEQVGNFYVQLVQTEYCLVLKLNSCTVMFAEEVSRFTVYHTTGNLWFPENLVHALWNN